MLKINWSKFKGGKNSILSLVDLLMILLVIINLLYIIVEWSFSINFVNEFLNEIVPTIHSWYDTHLHRNFFWYDMYFVAIFITEFCVRWFHAVYHNHHHKWFFYPFVHWYDVLGCIPLGSFRILRIFRVGSMVLRLHKMGVINIRQTYFFKMYLKYSAVVVEEISDRVVVNVLSGVQDEMKHGTPIVSKIIVEVVRPQKEILVQWLSTRIKHASNHHFEQYQSQLREYVNRKVAHAVRGSSEVKDIAAIPLVGGAITGKLEKAVSDITFAVIEGIMKDLSSEENTRAISELADVSMDMVLLEEEDEELNQVAVEMVSQSIEIIKDQVKIKRWKEEEASS